MPKNPKSRDFTCHASSSQFTTDFQPRQHLFSQTHPVHIHVHIHYHLTHHHHQQQHYLDDPHFLLPSLNRTLPKRFSSQIQDFEKGIGRIQWKLLCQLCREEWQNEYMRFYGALEWQVQDQIQHKHFGDHIFRLHQGDHQKTYVRMDNLEHELYSDGEILLVSGGLPWSMMRFGKGSR